MKRILIALTAALLLIAAPSTAATTSSPPPTPGQWRPSSIAGCWASTLAVEHQSRPYTLSGHRFVEHRIVATVLRWCPSSGYELVTWRSKWGPGRR